MLLVRAGSWLCALPITDVVETMRALPLRPIEGAPSFVEGVSIIRGSPLPVLHLASLFGVPDTASRGPVSRGRFVTMRAGSRHVALHVDAVVGAKHIDADALMRTPPLLSEALPEHADRMGALDGQLVATLRAARVLSDEAWGRLLGETKE